MEVLSIATIVDLIPPADASTKVFVCQSLRMIGSNLFQITEDSSTGTLERVNTYAYMHAYMHVAHLYTYVHMYVYGNVMCVRVRVSWP